MAYAFSSRRAMAFLMISTMLVGCSADGLMPMEPVDTGARVSSIRPMVPPAGVPGAPMQQGYAGVPQPMAQTYSQNQSVQNAPDQAAIPSGEVYENPQAVPRGEQLAVSQPVVLGAPPAALGTLTVTSGGAAVSADSNHPGYADRSAMQGEEAGQGASEARVVGLAEEQDVDIADPPARQNNRIAARQSLEPTRPVSSGMAPAAPLSSSPVPAAGIAQGGAVSRRAASPVSGNIAAATPRWSDQSRVIAPSRPAPEPEEVAMLMPGNPAQSRRLDAPADGPMPASEIACRRELSRMGVEFRDKPRISDGPSCGIDYPVELSGLSGNIDVKPGVTLNCQTTLAFAKWVKNELAPSSRLRYLTGVKTIVPLGGYSCRRMNNSRQRYNPMSEHARGNAIDVGKFVLKNGHEIDVRKKGLFSFREGALLKAVRTDSCKYFNTVLGPGSNKEHWNHFHFDLRSRATGNRYCD